MELPPAALRIPKSNARPGKASLRMPGSGSETAAAAAEKKNRSLFLAQLRREKSAVRKIERLAVEVGERRQTTAKQQYGSSQGLTWFPPVNKGCELPDCDRMVVTEKANGEEKPSESTTVMRGATGVVYNFSNMLQVRASSIEEQLGLSDIVNNNLSFSWSRVPEELRALWPEFDGLWDDAGSSWLYFKYIDPERAPVGSVCERLDGLEARAGATPVYVASGMMPYAVYDFREIETVVTCTGPKVKMRIRYWVGFIHHFSFFVTREEGQSFTIADLPREVSDLSTTDTDFLGTRVAWWVGYTGGLRATLLWGYPQLGAAQRIYKCNEIERMTSQFPGGYQKSTSDSRASGLCFSNRNAGPGDMTSLLAESATGEVCFVVEPDEAWDHEGLLKEGFDRLFGGVVTSQLRLEYLVNSRTPYTVERTVSIGVRSLTSVSDLYRRVNNLRQTDAGKWLHRSHDVNLLLDIATSEEEGTEECCS
jgi:hypothetical protein